VFLISMDRPGIEVRPIHAVGGPHDFNEVFFEEAFVADEEVLGDVDKGWDVIRASLSFERVGTARYARSDRLLAEARASLLESDQPVNAHAVGEWVDSLVDTRVARLLSYRAVAERERDQDGAVSSLHSSVARIANTLNDQQATAVVYDILSPASMLGHGEADAPLGGEPEHEWRWGLAATVAAGTLEIQQIIVARELLGRPQRPAATGS
jgi:alkylation response protein AidB-like acyl-CoA dehydrogenase